MIQVFLLLLADTVNTVFDWIYLYDSLIIHFGMHYDFNTTAILPCPCLTLYLFVDDAVFLSKANWGKSIHLFIPITFDLELSASFCHWCANDLFVLSYLAFSDASE